MRKALLLLVVALVAGARPAAAAPAPAGVQITDATGCPSATELHDSLEARLPGVVREPGGELPLIGLRVSPEAAPGAGLRLELIDANGAVVLERALRQAGTSRTDDATCAALADTVALIVARFLREIGYQGPPARTPPAPAPAAALATPPPPPAVEPPPWNGFVGLGAAGRVGFGGSAPPPRAEAALTLGVSKGHAALVVTGGLAAQVTTPIAGTGARGQFHLREYPVRLLGGARFELAGGALIAGAALAANVLSFDSEGVPGAVTQQAVEWAGEGACQYGRLLLGPVGLRVAAAAGLVAAPRDFDVGGGAPVYGTPRVYLRLELGLGVAFGKF